MNMHTLSWFLLCDGTMLSETDPWLISKVSGLYWNDGFLTKYTHVLLYTSVNSMIDPCGKYATVQTELK